MDELERLMAAQAADDTHIQRPQMFGGDHGTPTLSIDSLGEMGAEELLAAGATQSAEEEYLMEEEPTLFDFEAVVLNTLLTASERELYLMVHGEGLSLRQVAERTGLSKSTVDRQVKALRVRLADLVLELIAGDK